MKKEVKRGTYRVTFHTGEQVIFGNNYKPWWQHCLEFTFRKFGSKTQGWRYDDVAGKITAVEYSNQQFFDDGGLKWCGVDAYQEVINEVCERDGIVPIPAELITFRESPADMATLTKEMKKY